MPSVPSESQPLKLQPSKSHPKLNSPVFNDSSTATAGLIADELIEEGLLQDVADDQNMLYGAIELQEQPQQEPESEYAVSHTELVLIMTAISMGCFLSLLDTTVVTTLLTVIASDLNALPRMSFIGTSYLLSCSAFQPLFGRISDIYGRKAILLLCAASFAIGCLICGLSRSLWPLVVGRFITGIGGGGLTSLGTITMSDLVSLRKRGLFQGITNIFFSIGALSGGLIGGVISDNFGWRYVFYLQIPLLLLSGLLLLLFLNLPEGSTGRGVLGTDMWGKLKQIDWLGSALLVSSLTGIICAAAFGGSDIAYTSVAFVALCVLSLLLLALFAYLEVYVIEKPIIPVRLLADRSVLSCSLLNWFYTLSVFGCFFYVPVYFASVIGLNSTQNGLRVVPNFIISSGSSVCTGIYMKKTGKYLKFLIVAATIGALGNLALCFVQDDLSIVGQYTVMILPQIAYAVVLTVTLLGLIALVPPEHQLSTTSIQYTFRSTGSTLGVSICSAIFTRKLGLSLVENLTNAAPEGVDIAKIVERLKSSAEYIKILPLWSVSLIRESYFDGCHSTFVFSFFLTVLGVVSCCCIKEYELHTSFKR